MAQGTLTGGRKMVVGTRRPNMLARPRFRLARSARKLRQPAHKGTVGLRIDGVEAIARNEVQTASDAAAKAYEEIMVPWFKRIERDWPVRTGFSKSVLQIHARSVQDTLIMTIEDLASYAFYIRQSWHATPNVAKRLLWDPSKKVGDRMLQRLGEHIQRG